MWLSKMAFRINSWSRLSWSSSRIALLGVKNLRELLRVRTVLRLFQICRIFLQTRSLLSHKKRVCVRQQVAIEELMWWSFRLTASNKDATFANNVYVAPQWRIWIDPRCWCSGSLSNSADDNADAGDWSTTTPYGTSQDRGPLKRKAPHRPRRPWPRALSCAAHTRTTLYIYMHATYVSLSLASSIFIEVLLLLHAVPKPHVLGITVAAAPCLRTGIIYSPLQIHEKRLENARSFPIRIKLILWEEHAHQ